MGCGLKLPHIPKAGWGFRHPVFLQPGLSLGPQVPVQKKAEGDFHPPGPLILT